MSKKPWGYVRSFKKSQDTNIIYICSKNHKTAIVFT